MNRTGKSFDDVSQLSGMDCPGDTRSSVLLDFDRDGWLDVAFVNANAPAFRIFRNGLGDADDADANNRSIAVRLVGGAKPGTSQGFAPRDGYGGKVYVRAGGKTYLRESRAGEGFAAQNSRTLLIGIGTAEYAEEVEIRWPSGRTQKQTNVAAGTVLTCYEDTADSPDASQFASEPYLRNAAAELLSTGIATTNQRPVLELSTTEAPPQLRMVTTMATWCVSCKSELPQLEQLREGFAADELAMYAAPIDINDDSEKLSRYQDEYQPAYHLLAELSADKRRSVQAIVKQMLGTPALPATLILNRNDEVIAAFPGVPTVSAVRRLMATP